MAKPKKDKATVDETASVKEGDPFLASHVHVDRDGETVALPAGHFVSELDTDLTDAERKGLEQRNALRPATADDVAAVEARHSVSASTKLQREHKATRQQLKAEQGRELKQLEADSTDKRRAMITEHDAAREEMEKGLAKETAQASTSAAIPVAPPIAPSGGGTGELGASTGVQPGAAHPDKGQE